MTPAAPPRQGLWWCSCRSTCTRKVICSKPAVVRDTRETVDRWKCTRKATGALVLVHSAGCHFRQISQNCHHYWVKAWEVGNWLFFRVKVKVQNMRFVKILVFIGCWMKTFWSSLVLGIRERTGQPIPNGKGNLFESKSARTKTFRNTFQWNVRLWE